MKRDVNSKSFVARKDGVGLTYRQVATLYCGRDTKDWHMSIEEWTEAYLDAVS